MSSLPRLSGKTTWICCLGSAVSDQSGLTGQRLVAYAASVSAQIWPWHHCRCPGRPADTGTRGPLHWLEMPLYGVDATEGGRLDEKGQYRNHQAVRAARPVGMHPIAVPSGLDHAQMGSSGTGVLDRGRLGSSGIPAGPPESLDHALPAPALTGAAAGTFRGSPLVASPSRGEARQNRAVAAYSKTAHGYGRQSEGRAE